MVDDSPRVTRKRTTRKTHVTRERRMTFRGDKVIPLDVRLGEIETTLIALDKRIDKLMIIVAVILTVSHTPQLADIASQIVRLLF